MKSLVLIALSCSFLLSCSENVQDLITENKGNAEKKFDQFYVCYEIAKSTAPLTENKINWETEDAKVKYGESNVYQIGFENFKDLASPLDIAYDGSRRREHADMAKLFDIDLSSHLESHSYQVDPEYSFQNPDSEDNESCVEAIHHFLDTKYLLINRTHSIIEPKYIGGESFEMGTVTGDVLVFDVEKGILLGGFSHSTSSRSTVETGDTYEAEISLKADLELAIITAIKSDFLSLAPFLGNVGFDF